MFALGKWRIGAATLIVSMFLFAACNRAERVRTMSLREVQAADAQPNTRGTRVSATAEVTYSDPEWNLLFLQDHDAAVYIAPPANNDFKAGDVLRVTGTTSDFSSILQDTQFSVVARGRPILPATGVRNASEFPNYASRLVSTNATVHWAGIRDGRAALDAVSSGVPFQAVVFPGTTEDLPRIGSDIKITGVAAAIYSNDGSIEKLQLLTPSAHFISVIKPGPADPFTLPLKSVGELASLPIGTLAHVTGRVVNGPSGLLLQEDNQSVPIHPRESVPPRVTAADVTGFWTGQGLADTMLRPRGQQMPARSDIEHLVQLKRMSSEEAAKHHSVHVRATVTYFDPDWHLLFLQDGTAAAFANSRGVNMMLKPGDFVDVTGVSDPGDFAPVISNPIITFVSHGKLPSPVQLDVVHGDLNEADSIWCTFRGIVHSARESSGHTVLKLEAGQTALEIDLPTIIDGQKLVDKEISVAGALGILFNERRQAVGHQIFVPGPEFLKVVDSTVQPHPPVSIVSLRRYSPNSDEHHSVSVVGSVVAKSSNRVIVVQDSTAGVQVRTVRPTDVSDGDRVVVRGFILPGEYSPVLEDAVVQRISSGTLPWPQPISAKTALEGGYDSEYVQIPGTLTDLRTSPRGVVLTVNNGDTFFEAAGPANDDLSSLRLGSQVSVRGVCQVMLDRSSIPYTVHGFTLKFDSPDSVLILKRGPWWDARKIGWALLLIFVFGASAASWAAMLRRQVLLKTSELQSSLEEKRLAAKFDSARNQVLESIVGNVPLGESMERLVLAIEEQIPKSACGIVLPPDGKSFQEGKPSPILLAPSLSEDIHRAMVPVLASVFIPGSTAHDGNSENDHEIMDRLLGILRQMGHSFRGSMMVAFSGHGDAAGILLIFRRTDPLPDAKVLEQEMLQSASRLVALASDHWQMHARLLHEARHDALTGLPNRTVAEDRLEQALARAHRARKSFALFCIDLDGFKAINDERGHDAGDEILRGVSQRLRNSLRHADTLARMGGDEFLVLIEDCAGEAAARSVAQSLISSLQEPFMLNGRQLSLSGSIGIATYPADGRNAAQLRRHADLAMYRAKAQGGGQVALSVDAPASGQSARKSVTT